MFYKERKGKRSTKEEKNEKAYAYAHKPLVTSATLRLKMSKERFQDRKRVENVSVGFEKANKDSFYGSKLKGREGGKEMSKSRGS